MHRSSTTRRHTSRARAAIRAHALHALLALLAGALLASCTATGPRPLPGELPLPEGPLAPADVETQVEAGEQALADQRPWHAIARAIALRELPALPPEGRAEVERLLEEAMVAAARQADDSDDFDQVSPRLLPRRSRAIHAIGKARLELREGDEMDAYRTVRELELEHPTHHLRPEAGDVVADAGLELARGGGRYLIFFSDRRRAPTVLEHLVLEHPAHPRAPEAYAELAELYVEQARLDLAIERHSDLLLYHPTSPQARRSEALVPELRLARLQRDDYDRGEVQRATDELERWLERHAGTAADEEAHVRALLDEARTRLVRHDLITARFYLKVDRPFGAKLHADRARELAVSAGFDELAAEAGELAARADEEGAAEDVATASELAPDASRAEAAAADEAAP